MGADDLGAALVELQKNPNFSEAVLLLRDQSRLCFCHRVGERWAKAVGPAGKESEAGLAGGVLAQIAVFRLNSRHLDVHFLDGSHWEKTFGNNPGDQSP
jgi:hypothetical protein